MLAQSLAAFRVTGDASLLSAIKNRLEWIRTFTYFPRYGNFRKNGEASFQMGFMARTFSGAYNEMRNHHPEHEARAFQFLWGIMDWQLNSGRFGYYVGHDEVNNKSSGSGLSMIDPEVYWYQITGQEGHRTLVDDFIDGGVGDGKAPYGNNWGSGAWNGSYETRAYWWHIQEGVNNHARPGKVTNLSASVAGGKVRASFTAPANAERVLLVWSTEPIAPTYDSGSGVRQAWASNSAGIFPVAAGASKTIEFEVSASGTIYVALVALTEKQMSDVSNVATVSVP